MMSDVASRSCAGYSVCLPRTLLWVISHKCAPNIPWMIRFRCPDRPPSCYRHSTTHHVLCKQGSFSEP